MGWKEKSKTGSWDQYKSCICVRPTLGSDLHRRMQKAEHDEWPGGREDWPIKVFKKNSKVKLNLNTLLAIGVLTNLV